MTKTVHRSTWIVTAMSTIKDKRELTIVCETPEEAIHLFAGTVFGRSGRSTLIALRRGEGVYVAEKDDTTDDD